MITSKFVKFFMSVLKWQANFSPNFVSLFSFIKDKLLCTFLAQAIYTLLKRTPLNWKFLRLLSAQVKICQIPIMPILKRQADSSPNFVSSLVSWNITPLYLFTSNNVYFTQKDPIKVKTFETFECSGQNLSNSLCQFWNN